MKRLESLKLRMALRRARRELSEVHRTSSEAYKRQQSLFKSKESADELAEAEKRLRQTTEVSAAKAHEVEGLKARIDQIRQSRLFLKLVKRGLELPDPKSFHSIQVKTEWGSKPVNLLSPYEESKVNRRLRLEKRESWKFGSSVILPIITALTGLIGTLIGLFSSAQFVAILKQIKLRLFG
jgi:hypothetical protein